MKQHLHLAQVPGVLLGQLKPLLLGGPAQSFVDSDAFLWQFASRQCWSPLVSGSDRISSFLDDEIFQNLFMHAAFKPWFQSQDPSLGFWFRSLRAQRKCRLLSLTLEEMVDTHGIAWHGTWQVCFPSPKWDHPCLGHQGTWPRVFQRSALPQSGRERGGYLYIYICVCV